MIALNAGEPMPPAPTPTPPAPDVAAPRLNRAQALADDLRARILGGEISIGAKLPSESALTGAHGVSRTVVREALASLRAEGLVESRQGAGVFVIADGPSGDGAFQGIDPDKISSIIEVLELRAAVEVEAAALAARRRSAAQEDAIFKACTAMEGLVAQGAPSIMGDFAFHLAVAAATNNPRFTEFLDLIGVGAIPRAGLAEGARSPSPYLSQIAAEHRAIAVAIAGGDESAAKAAMRTHLSGSRQRYRAMLRRA
ncbi:MAG: GntR family transcriptional repressor for pyruvate dehydrogenase complex [Paracoccaceae bacterium]|jgi:GntR family transcriptional repressor for pyruvate dehydrogenase complex